MKNRTQYSLINAIVALVFNIISLILGLFSRSIFVNYLSIHLLGYTSTIGNILVILSFAEFGLGNVLSYYLYAPIKNVDESRVHKLLKHFNRLYIIVVLVMLLLGIIVSFAIDKTFDLTAISEQGYNALIIYFLLLANSLVSYAFILPKTILQASQRNYLLTITNGVFHFAQIILQIIVLVTSGNIYVYYIIQIAMTLIGNYVIKLLSSNQLKNRGNYDKSECLSNEEKRDINRNITSLAISKVSGLVMNGTDNIIISAFLGFSSSGLVANYTLVTNTLNNLLFSIFSSTTSSIGNMNVDAPIEKKKSIYNEYFYILFVMYGYVTLGVSLFIDDFVYIWLGDEYRLPFLVVISLVFLIYMSGINYINYTFRTTHGYFVAAKYVYVVSAFLNIILSIILVNPLGLAGVYIGTIISKLLTTEILDAYYTQHVILKVSLMKYYIRYFYHILVLFTLYMVFHFLFSFFVIDNFMKFAFAVLAFSISFSIIVFIMLHKNKSVHSVIIRFGNLLKMWR